MALHSWANLILTVSMMIATGAVVRINKCRDDEFSCLDETCISREQDCDSQINCPDASDEYLAHCENSRRQIWPIAFHCTVALHEVKYHQLCHPLCFDWPDFCLFAMMTMTEQAPGTCKLPDWPVNGSYEIKEAESYASFSMHFYCNRGYDLAGPSYVRCENGVMHQELPTCKLLSGWGVADEDFRK